jgi:hypothetical protein
MAGALEATGAGMSASSVPAATKLVQGLSPELLDATLRMNNVCRTVWLMVKDPVVGFANHVRGQVPWGWRTQGNNQAWGGGGGMVRAYKRASVSIRNVCRSVRALG